MDLTDDDLTGIIFVERRILIEVKAHRRRLGLILNFNVKWMKAGIRRVVWDPPQRDAE